MRRCTWCDGSEAVKKLEKSPKRKKYFLVIKHLRARISGVFNFFTASQSRRVGRVCPQRAGPRSRKYGGALNNIGENLVFLRRFSGDTEQIAQTDDKGGRVSRSVWSAWSLLPLSDVWRGSKAGASSTHSIRFARFGSGYAGLGTDAPYLHLRP